MAQVTVGGTSYQIPVMNFVALERAWPYIKESSIQIDPIKAVDTAIHIIGAALVEADDFNPTLYGITLPLPTGVNPEDFIFSGVVKFLKKKTIATEIENIRQAVESIVREAGLEASEGELDPAGDQEAPNPSPETLDPSLLS